MKLLNDKERDALKEFIIQMIPIGNNLESYLAENENIEGIKPKDNPLRKALEKLGLI